MEPLLVKIFAIALAFSQVATAPDAVKMQFDRARDQEQVAELLHAGCTQLEKTFDIEGVNLDDLIATVLEDPQVIAGGHQLFRGINFADLQGAYRQFCKSQRGATQTVDLGEVIDYYNKAAADLPDAQALKNLKCPAAGVVLDGAGRRFAELFEEDKRCAWVPLAEIPIHVQATVVAVEDRRFYQHHGIDERGLIRAFVGNLAGSGRPQGGSTITQQVVKNLMVGDALSYERKIREMLVAARVERLLSKTEILELYLNSVYFGRGAWGIEMGARAYFDKPASKLTQREGALLAALIKGPNYFNPDRYPERARERLAYVFNRLQEDGLLPAAQPGSALPDVPTLIDHRPRRDIGFYFSDQVLRETKSVAGIEPGTGNVYTVQSTINQTLQRAVEEALQEGLSRYERDAGRAQLNAPEANLAQAIHHAEADSSSDKRPAWQRALMTARLPLYDVHWAPAVVINKRAGKRGGRWRVGLRDGRIVPLSMDGTTGRKLQPYDVVLVHVDEDKGGRAFLRVRPEVQGAAVVLENKTGRILAMTGGFSHPLSQLNRVVQATRQPGSTIKPLIYLAALGRGVQPNTRVLDEPITLPPIGGRQAGEGNYWTPKNYDGGSSGVVTLRSGLEQSRNLATVHLLMGGIGSKPEYSLDRLCELAVEAQIYRECVRFYPFVLGAQPVRPIDLAAFYASIANEGRRPTPYVVESIACGRHVIYRHQQTASVVDSVDQAAFYQLKTILQGVLARGTAKSIADLAPYVAGKTGTSDDENDAWFVGFTNDVTVAIWVGYDNGDGKRRTLGGGSTGGSVAVPIFEPIIRSVWSNVAPKTILAPPSPQAILRLVYTSHRRGAPSEWLRVDANGKVLDTENALLSGKGVETDGWLTSYERVKAPSTDLKEREADWSEKPAQIQDDAAHADHESKADASESKAQGAAAKSKQESEIPTPAKKGVAQAETPGVEQDRDGVRSRRHARTKSKHDSAAGDREVSRANRASRYTRVKAEPGSAKQDRVPSASEGYARASRSNAPRKVDDPRRSQENWQRQPGLSPWSWQEQYGQARYWGRWQK